MSIGVAHASFNNLHNVVGLASVIVCLGAIILTFYLAMRLYLAKGIVLDQQVGPWAAIKKSFRATKYNVWRLIGLTLLNAIILLVSVIPLGIGLIWSLPYLFINYGMVYRRLVIEKSM